jgi:hypothetical protein
MRAPIHPKLQEALITEFMDPGFLEGLEKDFGDLLGYTYEVILRRDKKEQYAKPVKQRHRLAVLLDVIRKHQSGMRRLPLSIPAAVGELAATRRLLTVSRQNPIWPKLISGLRNPDEYLHTVVMLGAADFFLQRNSKVELMEESNGRMCDLRLIAPDGYVNVEVKTPRELVWPPENLTPSDARRHVTNQFHKAGTTPLGQLPPDAPGLLIMGGSTLDARVHELFEAAGRWYFEHPPADYSHIIGVVFSWIGTVMTSAEAEIVGDKFSFDTMLALKTENCLVQNPIYSGRFFINLV